MSCKIDELTMLNEEHQKHMLSLEESLRKEKADKLVYLLENKIYFVCLL